MTVVKNVVDTVVGLLIVVVAVVVGGQWYQKTRMPGGEDHYRLYAVFTDMTGLEMGSDVRISGIPVGHVSGYQLDTKSYMAKVAMSVRKEVLIPKDSTASVSSDGIFGKKYLKVVPGSQCDYYATDDIVELTQPPFNIEDLISGLLFKTK